MRTILFVILMLLIFLAGCGSMGYQGMSAEQIAATAKMKDANINCTVVNSPWGRGINVFVNVDRGVVQNGAVVVGQDCGNIQFTNSLPPPPPPAPNPPRPQ